MNPKDQIHYDIAELLEKIAHLNIKLASTSKIHPVEIDLLRTYISELTKQTDALPVMPLAKSSFSIPDNKQEATTLPSFDTAAQPEPDKQPIASVDAPDSEPEVTNLATNNAKEPDVTEKLETEEATAEEPVTNSDAIETVEPEPAETQTNEDTTANFAFDDLAAPVTEPTAPVEEPNEDAIIEEAPAEPETAETTEDAEALADEEPISFVNAPVDPEELTANSAPEPLPEAPLDEPASNTGPELPIVETPLSYEPPVKEPEAKRSINDMFSREGKEDLGSKFLFQNRKNLREMIDLSERYVFTKELFGGDADYYDKAIRQLNQFEKLEDAEAYMSKELYPKYNWAGKDAVQKQFARIVERRFA